MSDQMNDVDAFFSKHDQKADFNQKIMDGVSGDQSERNEIKVPGTYVCKVKTATYKKKGEDIFRVFPRLELSANKGVLQCHMLLEVTKGTEVVPVGATIFYTLTLLQPDDAPAEKIQNTYKFLKPVLVKLTGLNEDEIGVTSRFFKEYCSVDFDSATGKILRDHKMNKEVLVVVKEDWDEKSKSMKYNVDGIMKCTSDDKSISVKNAGAATNDLDLTKGGSAEMSQYVAKTVEVPQEKPSLAPADDDVPSS